MTQLFILFILCFCVLLDSFRAFIHHPIQTTKNVKLQTDFWKSKKINTKLFALDAGYYLGKMVERKKVQVENLIRRHSSADDPLFLRMSYMNNENQYNITKSIKKLNFGLEEDQTMTLIVDMKRKSPTIPQYKEIVDFPSASKFGEMLVKVGVDALFVNIDEIDYGGSLIDLKETSKQIRHLYPHQPPACIAKDIIIHPIQIAQAVVNGASGVILITSVVGPSLEDLLNSCTIMGIEAIVEVHTPNELEFALDCGATIFLVNMWDRITGKHYPENAKALTCMMPFNALAIACGNIQSMKEIEELGLLGYDAVVLGRNIDKIENIKVFAQQIHNFRGRPRNFGLGMKSIKYAIPLEDK